MQISSATEDHLIRHGYALVPGFLTPDELASARANMARYFPSVEELSTTPERFGFIHEDPEHLQVEFPFAGDALNDIATHPELIAFVERLLGTTNVLLSQSAIWAKYAGTGDFDQEMHLDYQGNTLVVPRDEGSFRQVNMIVYYTDVTPELGPTCVVPAEHAAELSTWPPFRPRRKWSELYRNEKPILLKAGGLFVFGMGTFHRASQMTAASGVRFTHHLVWRSGDHPFAGYQQWSRFGENALLERFIERTTPRQREVLGFPPPGHPYWNAQTLSGVAARYPKMNLRPYRATATSIPPKPASSAP